MSYYAVIILVMMAFAIASLCLLHHERANRQLYCVAFAAFAILICAKYYYGPDIISYVPYYESVESVSKILSGEYDDRFEIGFALFCSIAHGCGLLLLLLMGTMLTVQGLYGTQQQRWASVVIVLSGCISVALNWLLIPVWHAGGCIAAWYVAECVEILMVGGILWRYKRTTMQTASSPMDKR